MKNTAKTPSSKDVAEQIAGFIAKSDASMGKCIRSARSAVRRRFPTAIELVYDNYNFLVFGFCASERASDAIVSLAANAKGVGLCFIYGSKLADPRKILLGSGNQTRFIRLERAATLARPEVKTLLAAAIRQAKTPLPSSGTGLHRREVHFKKAKAAPDRLGAKGVRGIGRRRRNFS